MPDDKMRNDDLNRQAGNKGYKDQGYSQQSPGRSPIDNKSTSQRQSEGNEPRHGEGMSEKHGGRQGNKGSQKR